MSSRPSIFRGAALACAMVAGTGFSISAQQQPKTTAPAAEAPVPGQPLTNARVIGMVKKGASEDAIIAAIRAGNTRFDLDANAVAALAQSGVPRRVIDAMKATDPNAGRGSDMAPAGTRSTAKPEPPKKFCFAMWCR